MRLLKQSLPCFTLTTYSTTLQPQIYFFTLLCPMHFLFPLCFAHLSAAGAFVTLICLSLWLWPIRQGDPIALVYFTIITRSKTLTAALPLDLPRPGASSLFLSPSPPVRPITNRPDTAHFSPLKRMDEDREQSGGKQSDA